MIVDLLIGIFAGFMCGIITAQTFKKTFDYQISEVYLRSVTHPIKLKSDSHIIHRFAHVWENYLEYFENGNRANLNVCLGLAKILRDNLKPEDILRYIGPKSFVRIISIIREIKDHAYQRDPERRLMLDMGASEDYARFLLEIKRQYNPSLDLYVLAKDVSILLFGIFENNTKLEIPARTYHFDILKASKVIYNFSQDWTEKSIDNLDLLDICALVDIQQVNDPDHIISTIPIDIFYKLSCVCDGAVLES